VKKLLNPYSTLCLLAVTAMLFIGPGPAGAAQTEEAGLPIGQKAPAFQLPDQNGAEVSLAGLLKQGPVVLVFIRSADWCPACKLRAMQFQRNLKAIEASGGHIVGISFDSTAAIKKFADRQKITFPLLSDADSKTIGAYGMRNQDTADGSAVHGIFVIDQKATIRAKLFPVSHEDSEVVAELTNALKAARNVKEETKP